MLRRNAFRSVFRVALLGAIGTAIAAACGFPDATFVPDDFVPEAGSDAPTAPPSSEGGSDAGKDVVLPPDVDPNFNPDASHDAATRDDASVIERPDGGDGGAGGCGSGGGSSCDCDDDDSKNSSCASTTADCDDFDPLVKPGQGFVAAAWDTRSPWQPQHDWNCDGTVTKQYPYGVTCGLLANCSQGFATDVACGQSGTYNFCEEVLPLLPGLPIICRVKSTETRTQGCK